MQKPHESKTDLDLVCLLPNGSGLYRESNGVGGHRYWSDEVGGGVCVWDTCLVGSDTLLAALTEEARRSRAEQIERLRADRKI